MLTEAGRKATREQQFGFDASYGGMEVLAVEVIKPDGKVVSHDPSTVSKEQVDRSGMDANIFDPNSKVLDLSVPDLEIGDMLHVYTRSWESRPRMQDARAFSPTLSEEWRDSVMGMNQSPALAADGSLLVTGTDVLHRYWSAPCANADLDCDGAVNGRDLGILLGAWGPCAGSPCAGDINRDGTVNGSDLGVLLGAWG